VAAVKTCLWLKSNWKQNPGGVHPDYEHNHGKQSANQGVILLLRKAQLITVNGGKWGKHDSCKKRSENLGEQYFAYLKVILQKHGRSASNCSETF
jgi:hypothetical protein